MAKEMMKKISLLTVMVLTVAGCQSNTKPPATTTATAIIKTAVPQKAEAQDSDNDGVNDTIDQCPKTPENMVVEKNGCPTTWVNTFLKMEGRIFYPRNQTAIPKQAIQIPADAPPRNFWQEVTNIAKKWHEYPNATIHIEGHASKSEGKSEKERMQLSKLRASIVKYTLIHQFGVAPSKIFAVGYGANRPIAPDTDITGKSFNRRVYMLLSDSPEMTNNLMDKQGNPKPVASDGEIAD